MKKLPQHWQRIRLDELCKRITVGHVGPMVNEYVDAGVPFLRSQNVQPFVLDRSEIKYISLEFHRRIQKSALNPGDVVVVRTGYPGTACVIPNDIPELNCADLVILTPNDSLDPWYLSCIFNSEFGKGHVQGNLVGVAQQHFNVGVAKAMEIPVPPIAVQRRIASILSNYDHFIEINTRRIAILEEMARRIFVEWFVQFRAPGCDVSTLIESPVGPIPRGWEVVKLSDVAEIKYGYPFKSHLFNSDADGEGVIRIRDIKAGTTKTSTTEIVDEDYLVKNLDILIGMDGIFHICLWSGGRAYLNQRVVRLRAKEGHSQLWLFLITKPLVKRLEETIVGTTVAHLSARDLTDMNVLVASPEIRNLGASMLDPLATLQTNLRILNANLQAQREILLPKLTSGEIDVSVAHPLLEAAE